jgi:hypothetical protein
MPRVLNYSKLGFVPDGAVYVGRWSHLGDPCFGNPFREGVEGTREEVIALFEAYLMGNPQLLHEVKTRLKGKDLVCHCSPLPCHAQVLLDKANPSTIEMVPL